MKKDTTYRLNCQFHTANGRFPLTIGCIHGSYKSCWKIKETRPNTLICDPSIPKCNCQFHTANGIFPLLNEDVQLRKDLLPHVNILVLFVICLSFCERGTIPKFFTCTQHLQKWNQPRAKKLDARSLIDLKERKININVINLNRRENSCTPVNYDPRLSHLCFVDAKALDILRADRLNINQHSACNERVLHDHTYSRFEGNASNSNPEALHQPPTPVICPFDPQEMEEKCKPIKQGLKVSSEERQKIEEVTCLQAKCNLWYKVRQKRVTGYKCGQILEQKTRTVALLQSVLYSKQLDSLSIHIKWGQENKAAAQGWFGLSLDGIVIDSLENTRKEVKCPYIKRDVSPEEACQDPNFYCYISDDGTCTLKRSQQYYHQVQL